LLQHPPVSSESEIPDFDLGRALREQATRYPLSVMVARFVDRLTGLSTDEWESIQSTIKTGGIPISMLDASRNAAVALAVRDLISKTQFDQLYLPFLDVIPLESLEAPPKLD
jgi:hypothetical protein